MEILGLSSNVRVPAFPPAKNASDFNSDKHFEVLDAFYTKAMELPFEVFSAVEASHSQTSQHLGWVVSSNEGEWGL